MKIDTKVENWVFDQVHKPLGQCMYCTPPATEGLTDEHILPFSLAGKGILPNSSCKACAAITSEFETHCARNMFGRLRLSQNFPTRRPKRRKMTERAFARFNNYYTLSRVELPMHLHPAMTFFPLLPLPNSIKPFVLDGPQTVEIKTMHNQSALRRLEAFCKENDISEVIYDPPSINILSFARMLAKIGHGTITALLGIDGFTPLLKNLILGIEENWNAYVGGGYDQTRVPGRGRPHRIKVGDFQYHGIRYVFVKIRLFEMLGSDNSCPPSYYVIVGQLTEIQLEKLISYYTK